MEFSNMHAVVLSAFLLAIAFGAISQRAQFCTMGAISDWLHAGDSVRLRAWFLAIGVAILGVQFLKLVTPIDFGKSIYLTANLDWLGHLLGGILFGIGMTLASGCGSRTLVRAGGGNLKSLVVLLVLAVTAYMTLHGVLALVRAHVLDATSVNLSRYGISDQSVPSLLAKLVGANRDAALDAAVAVSVGLLIIGGVLAGRGFRRRFDQIFAGSAIGLIVVAGWYVTGVVGVGNFKSVPLESYAYVAPVAESLQYLMTFTNSTIGFGVAAVFGMMLGSFLYAIATGNFRIEGFASHSDLRAHLIGAALMGFGGVVALGCTVGQGISGMSTLALGSMLTLVSIIVGAVVTMKIQYYLLDNAGFLHALRRAFSDLCALPRGRGSKPV